MQPSGADKKETCVVRSVRDQTPSCCGTAQAHMSADTAHASLSGSCIGMQGLLSISRSIEMQAAVYHIPGRRG